MRPFAIGVLFCVLGCGGQEASAPPPQEMLIGTWGLATATCVVAHTFTADGRYENDLICPLDSGGFGLQGEVGTYSANASRINFSVTKDTCAPAALAYYVDYSIMNGRLSLTYSNGVEALAPYVPTGTGTATLGCWSMGTFTPAPLAPVP